MDVNTNEPLGLYKHTTLDTNTFSGKYKNDRSIFQWLESILIKRDKYPLLDDQRVVHSFDYQIKAVDQCDYQYIDSTKVEEPMTRHDRLYAFGSREHGHLQRGHNRAAELPFPYGPP